MGALYDALVNLSSVHDAEILDGYRRYVALLEAVLPPEEIDAYAVHIQQAGEIRIVEEMTPAEIAGLPPAMRIGMISSVSKPLPAPQHSAPKLSSSMSRQLPSVSANPTRSCSWSGTSETAACRSS